MKIVVYTQCWENYGSSEEPFWKAKGGNDIVIARLNASQAFDLGQAGMQEIVNRSKEIVDKDFTMFHEYIIDWEIMDDHEPTPFERVQIKYEGKIEYPAKDISREVEAIT